MLDSRAERHPTRAQHNSDTCRYRRGRAARMGNLTASPSDKLEFRGAAPGSALVDDHASCHYYRHGASSKRGIAIGRCLLCGLLSIGGLLLLFIGSFSDPITALHQMLSASTATQPVLTAAATAPSFGDDGQVTSVKPRYVDVEIISVGVSSTANAAMQAPIASTASVLLPPPSVGSLARHTNWPSAATAPARHRVRAYVTVSGRGTWLFAPNPNSGSNS